jgi:spermidine synthase
VLGGGDGFAVREILRHPRIEQVVLVDLDPAMTELFSRQEILTKLNERALLSPKVRVVNADAFTWLAANRERFEAIVADFPDPANFSLGKLYTTTFFQRATAALTPEGAMVVQTTSPYVARKSFWCVDATLRSTGLQTRPYHAYVPSFGEWGFIIAGREALTAPFDLPTGLKFISPETLPALFHFPPDMGPVETEVNRLNNQALVRYFEAEWRHYVH